MSRDWIHLLCLSICFHHKDTPLRFWAWLFSFLTSSERRNSIEHNLTLSAAALAACSCFDQRCKAELCLCPASRKEKAAEMKSFLQRNSSLVLFYGWFKELRTTLMLYFILQGREVLCDQKKTSHRELECLAFLKRGLWYLLRSYFGLWEKSSIDILVQRVKSLFCHKQHVLIILLKGCL